VVRQCRADLARLCFHAPVDGDGRRINELERGFRRDGLPNLIVGLTAQEDIFTRAAPFLVVVFVVEVVNASVSDAGWTKLLLALAGAVVLVGAFGLFNLARGRRFFSIPLRVDFPELSGFVLIPAVLPVILDTDFGSGIATVVVNLAILALTYVVVGFGLFSIVRWATVRLFAQLAASVTVLVRAVPVLLFFSLVTFFTTEIWQAFTATGPVRYWTAISMFVLLGLVFLSVRLPTVVREVQADSNVGVPLRRRERLNLAAVALISQSLQVLFVGLAVWLFYVVLGALLVAADVRADWLTHPEHVVWVINWFGERIRITTELLRVSTGVAAFAGLYYAVTIMFDAAYRDQFVDALTAELRDTFARRSEYLDLIERRDTTG
jgi:hypothetical protein